MAGTVRPYTMADIIGQLNLQSSQQSGSSVPLQGFFSSTAEQASLTDTVTATVATNPGWGAGTWGMSIWS